MRAIRAVQRIVAHAATRQCNNRITHQTCRLMIQRRSFTSQTSAKSTISIRPGDFPSISEYVDALIKLPDTDISFKEALLDARANWGDDTLKAAFELLTSGPAAVSNVKKWPSHAIFSALVVLNPIIAAHYLAVTGTPLSEHQSDAFAKQFSMIAKHFPVPLRFRSDISNKRINDIAFVKAFCERVQNTASPDYYSAFLAEYRSFQQYCYTDRVTRESTKHVHLERMRQILSHSTEDISPNDLDGTQSLFDYYSEHWDRFMLTRVPEFQKLAVSANSYQKQAHLPMDMRKVGQKSTKKPKTAAKLQPRVSDVVLPRPAVMESQVLDRSRIWRESHPFAVASIKRAVSSVTGTVPESLFGRALMALPPLPDMQYDTALPFPMSSFPNSDLATVDPASFLFPLQWTVGDLQFLSRLQAILHPVAYYHFRCTLMSLTQLFYDMRPSNHRDSHVTSSVLSSVAGELASWFDELISDVSDSVHSRLESELIDRLDRLCLVNSNTAPKLDLDKSIASSPSAIKSDNATLAWSQATRFPVLDLPFERHCFLTHLHEQALPAHATKLLLCIQRGILLQNRSREQIAEARDEAIQAAQRLVNGDVELAQLDETLDKHEHDEKNDLHELDDNQQSDDLISVDDTDATDVDHSKDDATAGSKPIKTSVRRLFMSTAESLFGAKSHLVRMCDIHYRGIMLEEWNEARLRAPESESHRYVSFYIDDYVSRDHSIVQQIKRDYRQPFVHRLLEANPAIRISHRRSDPDFAAFANDHAKYKIILTNIHPDISPRELMFSLRRLADVRGGEIFRERVAQSVLSVEMSRLRHEIKSIGTKKHKSLSFSAIDSQPSRAYCAVYFNSLAGAFRALTPNNTLLGISYRAHAMIPYSASAVTRVRITCGTGHSRSYNSLISQITQNLHDVCQPNDLVSVGTRQSLSDVGFIVIECVSHEIAVKVANKLAMPNMLAKHVKVSLSPVEYSRIDLHPTVTKNSFTSHASQF